MAQFQYRAADYQGQIVEGSLEAAEESQVIAKLHEGGLVPLRVVPAAEAGREWPIRLDLSLSDWRGRVRGRHLLVFTQELSTLLSAGMPLDRCLLTLSHLTDQPKLKAAISDILQAVQRGKSLAEGLAEHSEIFPPIYVNMVKAGEAGGVLDTVLARLVEYQERMEQLKEELRSALTYPVVLTAVSLLSVVFLITYVMPKFAGIFADIGAALPLPTRALLFLSDAMTSAWMIPLALVIGGGSVLGVSYVRTRRRSSYDQWKLRLPILGDIIRKIEVGRFARTLGTLLRSGVPMLQSLEITRQIATNTVIAGCVADVQVGVREGAGVARPLGQAGVFPPMAIQMIAVGEETGKLDEMLVKVADHFDREIRARMKRLTGLLEPALILLMGVMVGAIVISMLLGVFSINEIGF